MKYIRNVLLTSLILALLLFIPLVHASYDFLNVSEKDLMDSISEMERFYVEIGDYERFCSNVTITEYRYYCSNAYDSLSDFYKFRGEVNSQTEDKEKRYLDSLEARYAALLYFVNSKFAYCAQRLDDINNIINDDIYAVIPQQIYEEYNSSFDLFNSTKNEWVFTKKWESNFGISNNESYEEIKNRIRTLGNLNRNDLWSLTYDVNFLYSDAEKMKDSMNKFLYHIMSIILFAFVLGLIIGYSLKNRICGYHKKLSKKFNETFDLKIKYNKKDFEFLFNATIRLFSAFISFVLVLGVLATIFSAQFAAIVNTIGLLFLFSSILLSAITIFLGIRIKYEGKPYTNLFTQLLYFSLGLFIISIVLYAYSLSLALVSSPYLPFMLFITIIGIFLFVYLILLPILLRKK